MATTNNQKRYGFIPHNVGQDALPVEYRHVATAYDGAAEDTATTSVDLNVGDPVSITTAGTWELAASSSVPYGIIIGFERYWNASKNRMEYTNRLPNAHAWGTNLARRPRVAVVPATACHWSVPIAAAGASWDTLAEYLSLRGQNADHKLILDNSNTAKPKADPRIDLSTVNTTATLSWRIVDVDPTLHNEYVAGANFRLIVAANNVQTAGAAATPNVGV